MVGLIRFWISWAGVGLAVLASTSALAQSGSSQLAQANAALQAGEADTALALLNPLAQPGGKAEAYNLRCRVELTLEQWERAVKDCEQAARMDETNSDEHLWLARALGEKASRATFLSAYSLAKRVRAEFEEAVRLNPGRVLLFSAGGGGRRHREIRERGRATG
jgi:tetratricopeptide (TPR) repeat protein